MSVSDPQDALALLDLIKRLGRYGARQHARGLTCDAHELDAAIEEARLQLTRLPALDGAADQTRFAELVDELCSHRLCADHRIIRHDL